MHRRMLFKLGVSVVVGVAVILFYLVNVQEERSRSTAAGRAYRKLALGASPDYISSHLRHDLRKKADHEFLSKYAEALRIHTEIAVTRTGKDSDTPEGLAPGRAERNDGLFEDGLATADKKAAEPLHLLDGFAEERMVETNNASKKRDDDMSQLLSNRKVDHSVLDNPGKEHDFRFESEHFNANIKRDSPVRGSSAVHLCVVVCGTRSQETMTMLKSATMVTPLNESLVFHIFAEPDIQKSFQDELDLWPLVHRHRLSYHIYNVTFPDSSTTNAWKKLFKPCASQRLFLPNLLQSVERLIYVDTDTVFLESLTHLWDMFSDFNSSQLVGLVGEAESGFASWYNRFANHPFYGKFGLNSGVMLMDLTRLRQTSWLSDIQHLFKQYRMAVPWGDQDLINIYFAFHPDQMYLMPCKWNYRNDHCRYVSNCVAAEETGVSVLHGSRRTFESGKEPLLKIIHKAFSKYQLGDDMEFQFLEGLEADIKGLKHSASNCWKVSNIFLTQLQHLRERNKEFMHASRKANQKLSSARRQPRSSAAHANADRREGHHHQSGHGQRENAKVQSVSHDKPSFRTSELAGKSDAQLNKPQAVKEKSPASKAKKETAFLLQPQAQEKEVDGGQKSRREKSLTKSKESEKNSSQLVREDKPSFSHHKAGEKQAPRDQQGLLEDSLDSEDFKLPAAGFRDKKVQGHSRQAGSLQEKAKLDGVSSLKDTAKNNTSLGKSKSASGHTHYAEEVKVKSGKSVVKMEVDNIRGHVGDGKASQRDVVQVQKKPIDYEATEDKDLIGRHESA